MMRIHKEQKIALGMAAVFCIIFFTLQIWKFYNFQYNAMDLAIFNQTIFATAHGNLFASSIHPPSYLGDHFSPFLLVIALLYKLFSHPLLLLFLQTVSIASSSLLIYALAGRENGKKTGLLFVFLWLINPFVQNITLYEFHTLGFAILGLLLSLYYYQKNKFGLFLLFIFISFLSREDVALVTICFSVLAIIDKKEFKWIVMPAILSVGYFVGAIFTTEIFAPGGSYKFFIYYSWLGQNISEIIWTSVTKPQLIASQILSIGSIGLLLGLLMPLAFTSFFKVRYLLLSVLIYVQLVLGTSWKGLGTIAYTHYSALLLIGIFAASIFGWQNFQTKIAENSKKLGAPKKTGLLFILFASVYSSILLGPLPGATATLFTQGLSLSSTEEKWGLLNAIKNRDDIAATYGFLPVVSSGENIASLNYAFLQKTQFSLKDYFLPDKITTMIVDFSDFASYQLQYKDNNFYKEAYSVAPEKWQKTIQQFTLIDFAAGVGVYSKFPEKQRQIIIVYSKTQTQNNLLPIDQRLNFLGYSLQENNIWLHWEVKNSDIYDYFVRVYVEKNNIVLWQQLLPISYMQKIDGDYFSSLVDIPKFKKSTNFGTFHIDAVKIKSGELGLNSFRSIEPHYETTLLAELVTIPYPTADTK